MEKACRLHPTPLTHPKLCLSICPAASESTIGRREDGSRGETLSPLEAETGEAAEAGSWIPGTPSPLSPLAPRAWDPVGSCPHRQKGKSIPRYLGVITAQWAFLTPHKSTGERVTPPVARRSKVHTTA